MCDGQSAEQFVAGVIDDIDRVGWAVVAVEDDRGEHVHTYTAGLTRYHGHPELMVGGADFHTAHHVLDTLASAVQGGRRFHAGETVGPGELGCECVLVPVPDPSSLVLAQVVYGAFTEVPALLVVLAPARSGQSW
jgi:hypothetical protein